MIPVVDISRWQGKGNFPLLASLGVRGVIVRAGNGITPDPLFDTNIRQAKDAGLATGAYWFVNPQVGTAEVQGRMLAEAHVMQGCELPPMEDVESNANEPKTLPKPSPAQFADWLEVMTAEIERTRRPFFYSNAAYWNPNVVGLVPETNQAAIEQNKRTKAAYLNRYSFGDYDIIVARYPFYSPDACAKHVPPLDARDWDEWIMAETSLRPQVPIGWDTWDGWQFSAGYNTRGPVYGFQSSDLDLNIVRDDVWERWLGITRPPLIPPTFGDDMPAIVTNSESHQFTDGKTYDPSKVYWEVANGHKVHVPNDAVLKAYGGPTRAIALSNTELDLIPDLQEHLGEMIEAPALTLKGRIESVPGDITLSAG